MAASTDVTKVAHWVDSKVEQTVDLWEHSWVEWKVDEMAACSAEHSAALTVAHWAGLSDLH